MSHLEPSYLRYIYDGLEKGDLNPDNPAALPEGLIGLYDEAFDESKPARERQKLLKTFGLWSLLKKEVSAQFVAEILDVPTQEIIDFITTYSNWLTSPESGKYQLYHERLKVYLLQKISENEITILHVKLIKRLEQAIGEQKEDEFEVYGLEFIGAHYKLECISKIETKLSLKTFKKFKKIQFSQITQNRQKLISGGLNWTKQNLYYLAELSTKLDKSQLYLIVDLLCKINHEQLNILDKINNLITDYRFNDALKLVEELPSSEIEEIEIKIKHYLVLLFDALILRDYLEQKSVLISILQSIEDNIPINTDEYRIEQIIPSKTIQSVFLKLNLLEIENHILINRCFEWFDEEAYLGNDRNKIFDSISDETLDFLTKKLIDKVDINLIDIKIILNLSEVNIILSKNKNFLIEEIKFNLNQIDFFDTSNKLNELISKDIYTELDSTFSNISSYSSAHKFEWVLKNCHRIDLNITETRSLIDSVEEDFIKQRLISNLFQHNLINLELIDWAFSIAPYVTVFNLFDFDLELIRKIVLITKEAELIDICNLIIIFKFNKHNNAELKSKYRKVFEVINRNKNEYIDNNDFTFDFTDYFLLIKLAEYSILTEFEMPLFNKYCNLINDNESSNVLYYNTEFIVEFIPFLIFLNFINQSNYEILINYFLSELGKYEKYEHDELLYFFIDEINKYGRFDLALSLLENLKTINIKRQTLQHSFAKRIYFYFGLSNSVFKEYNIKSKFYRENIILGWSGLKYASLNSVGTDLPDVPITEFNNAFFEQNIVFALKNPKLLEGISESLLLNEYVNDTCFSFNNRGFILPRTLKRMNNFN
jgi:hypothetical protein